MSDRPRPLAGQVAIVTGASSGIGAAAARELAARGAIVVLAARRADELSARAHEIVGAGGAATPRPTDVAEHDQVNGLAEEVTEKYGHIDVVVNAAGANWRTALALSEPDEIARLLQVNLVGAILLTRAVLPGMLERGRGAIVSVGSLSGRVAMEPVYSATKYGLRGFSLALRRQLDGTGVSASLVSPGNVRTAMTRDVQAHKIEPEVVASIIADLVQHPRREVIVPWRHHIIAWLETGFPGLADRVYRWRHWSPIQ